VVPYCTYPFAISLVVQEIPADEVAIGAITTVVIVGGNVSRFTCCAAVVKWFELLQDEVGLPKRSVAWMQ